MKSLKTFIGVLGLAITGIPAFLIVLFIVLPLLLVAGWISGRDYGS